MTVLSNGFEGLTGTLTTANSDDAGGAALTVLGTPAVDTTYAAHGTKSLKIAAGVATATRCDVAVNTDTIAMRMYWRAPTSLTADWWNMVVAVGGTKIVTLSVLSNNKLRLFTAAGTGTTIWTSPNALSTTAWTRIELFVSGLSASTATVKVATYLGDSGTIDQSYDGTGISNTGASNFTNISFGRYQSTGGSHDVWIDDLAWEVGGTGFIGAVGANIPPTSTAPADVTNAVIGTPVVLTGTDSDSDGTVTTREWTCTGYPPGASSPTLTNPATAAVTFTPAAAGIYTMSYRVQDNGGAWSTPDVCLVYVPTSTIKAMAITSNPGNWTNVGGAADIPAALTDASDATYAQSATGTANPSVLRIRLFPLFTPTDFSMTLRHLLSAAGAGVAEVRLVEASTTRKTWTPTPTTSAADTVCTMTGGEIATVTSWLALDVEIEWSV